MLDTSVDGKQHVYARSPILVEDERAVRDCRYDTQKKNPPMIDIILDYGIHSVGIWSKSTIASPILENHSGGWKVPKITILVSDIIQPRPGS